MMILVLTIGGDGARIWYGDGRLPNFDHTLRASVLHEIRPVVNCHELIAALLATVITYMTFNQLLLGCLVITRIVNSNIGQLNILSLR